MFSGTGGVGPQRNLFDPDGIKSLHDLDQNVLAVAVRHSLERPAAVVVLRRAPAAVRGVVLVPHFTAGGAPGELDRVLCRMVPGRNVLRHRLARKP
jgi:hypothetical protein